MMANDKEVPSPSPARGRPAVGLPALTAAKLELYRAMLASGFGKEEFAARLKWTSSQVVHLFDGRHAVRLDQIETALAALGRRLVVTSEAA
jgi:antitoxin HicB